VSAVTLADRWPIAGGGFPHSFVENVDNKDAKIFTTKLLLHNELIDSLLVSGGCPGDKLACPPQSLVNPEKKKWPPALAGGHSEG
jgi:hypothetical protein